MSHFSRRNINEDESPEKEEQLTLVASYDNLDNVSENHKVITKDTTTVDSPTQPQHDLELDLIMGRNPTHPPQPQELVRHFQAT